MESTSEAEESWDELRIVDSYHDGPRTGIATFLGRPHVFECEFSKEEDAFTNRFWLMPIDDLIFQLAVERYQIFKRWKTAFDSGRTTLDTHPVLPEERGRYNELVSILGSDFRADRALSTLARAEFRRLTLGTGPEDFKVRWHPTSGSKPSAGTSVLDDS
jgi:hypothetical protein